MVNVVKAEEYFYGKLTILIEMHLNVGYNYYATHVVKSNQKIVIDGRWVNWWLMK